MMIKLLYEEYTQNLIFIKRTGAHKTYMNVLKFKHLNSKSYPAPRINTVSFVNANSSE